MDQDIIIKLLGMVIFFFVNINELLVGNSWTFGRVIVLFFHVLHAGDFGY